MPRWRSRYTSSSNSVVESCTGSPARRTLRLSRSTSMSPACSVVGAPCAATAQLGAHPRQQLRQREGLDQVVHRAGVEARDAILDLAPGGQHDHRQGRLGGAQRGQHLHAAAAREHQVEHDRVEALGAARGALPPPRRARPAPRSPPPPSRAARSRRSPARPRSAGSTVASPPAGRPPAVGAPGNAAPGPG